MSRIAACGVFLAILVAMPLATLAETPSREEQLERARRIRQLLSKLDKHEAAIIRAVNRIRKQKGLEILEPDLKLCEAARDHSNDMRTHGFYGHESPLEGKKTFVDRAKLFETTANGENICRGPRSGDAAMKMWMKSEPHRNNILNSSFRRIGVGRSDKYYTQMFGVDEG